MKIDVKTYSNFIVFNLGFDYFTYARFLVQSSFKKMLGLNYPQTMSASNFE